MYSLQREGYTKRFRYIYELIEDIIKTGEDPNYHITYNEFVLKQKAVEFIVK